jgi:class 3 adenylate cyclase
MTVDRPRSCAASPSRAAPPVGVTDFTALGDGVKITARLASSAGVGELLITDAAARTARLATGGLETRQLELKG